MAGKRSETSPVGSPSSGNISDKDQDRFLPIANVSRIMKKSLPANAKISKEAKETVQECVSEFISFITGEASDKCQREKRKTINGDDLLWAMTTLGFDNYIGPLKVYLNKYRETEGDKMINSSSIAGQKDLQSPTKDNYNNHCVGVGEDGFYSFGAQMTTTPKSFADHGRVIGYVENMNMVANAFNMGNIQEIGDGYANRPVTTHLHHGVEW